MLITGLVQGKNMWNGSGEYYPLPFTPGKKNRIRLVNTSTNTHFKFWIDQHILQVMSADFVPIEPYNTTILNIGIGQRYDLVVLADQPLSNYWIHCHPAQSCSANNNEDGILAIVNYNGIPVETPTSTPYVVPDENCEDETGLIPVLPKNLGNLSYGITEDIALPVAAIVRWTMNNVSFWTDFQSPTLLMIEQGNSSYPVDYNVVMLNGDENTVLPFMTYLIVVDLFCLPSNWTICC
jgi:FtsP/CotA-like multicopper oxidase with cupredoxin domain